LLFRDEPTKITGCEIPTKIERSAHREHGDYEAFSVDVTRPMAGSMAILRVTDLLKSYGGRRVVDGVSLEVESGEVVGLLGPNGAGKTTCFYMAIGLVKPEGGHIFLDGEDITDYPMHVRARRGLGYLPQETSVFRKLSVRENILAILELFPLSRDEQFERADQLLEELGIRHLSDQIAKVLSGGEKRRLEISRALSTNPSFMLLDEPFAGIDPLAVADIKNIITTLNSAASGSDFGSRVRETLGVATTSIMVDGRVIECGPPEAIMCNEAVCRPTSERFKLTWPGTAATETRSG
jgi:lipopolysaccharide export system ATP-binding protein